MPKASVGRVILAVIAGWLTNAVLTAGAEVLMWQSMRGPAGHFPLRYYIIDVICQCCFTALGGYLCCAIAGASSRVAMLSLMLLGLLIGGLSLPSSWSREPHWYRITLLAVWAPCVWLGWKLGSDLVIWQSGNLVNSKSTTEAQRRGHAEEQEH